MRKSIPIGAVALALALCGSAQAQTVFSSGVYDVGEQIRGTGSVSLGPGRCRFSFTTSTPFADFYGQVEKQSYYAEYCDEGDGEFFCGGNNVPTIPLFEPVTPTLYQLELTVNPFVETFTPGQLVVRTQEFDDCCTYAFDFTAGNAGSYSIAYAAVPEPESWALLIVGFGAVGAAWRRCVALAPATS